MPIPKYLFKKKYGRYENTLAIFTEKFNRGSEIKTEWNRKCLGSNASYEDDINWQLF